MNVSIDLQLEKCVPYAYSGEMGVGSNIVLRPRTTSRVAAAVRDRCRARGGRRTLVVPDPARRLQRPPPFRGIPDDARNRPQHPVEPARPAGRERASWQREPDPTDRRKVAYRLTDKGPRPAAGADLAPAMGREMDFGHAEQSGAGRPPQPAADRADGGPRRPTAGCLTLNELEWLDRADASRTED